MTTLRRAAAFLAGLALSGLALLLAVPAVYAASVAPPGGSPGDPPRAPGSGGGLVGWEIAATAVFAVLALALLMAVIARLHPRSRIRTAR